MYSVIVREIMYKLYNSLTLTEHGSKCAVSSIVNTYKGNYCITLRRKMVLYKLNCTLRGSSYSHIVFSFYPTKKNVPSSI